MSSSPTPPSTVFHSVGGGRVLAASPYPEPALVLSPGMYAYDLVEKGMLYMPRPVGHGDFAPLCPQHRKFIDDYHTFWKHAPDYIDMGIPHRRGWLLYGPPGTGKTTIIRMLVHETIAAGGIVMPIVRLNELEAALKVARVGRAPTVPVVIVMEDVEQNMQSSGWTSELTNLMDGMSDLNHIAFVATTNFITKVPARFRSRPGRFDVVHFVDYAPIETRRAYLAMLVRNAKRKPSAEVMEDIATNTQGLSMAHIKEVYLRCAMYGHDAFQASRDVVPRDDAELAKEAAESDAQKNAPRGIASFSAHVDTGSTLLAHARRLVEAPVRVPDPAPCSSEATPA